MVEEDGSSGIKKYGCDTVWSTHLSLPTRTKEEKASWYQPVRVYVGHGSRKGLTLSGGVSGALLLPGVRDTMHQNERKKHTHGTLGSTFGFRPR